MMAENKQRTYWDAYGGLEVGLVGRRSPGIVATLHWMGRALVAMYRMDLQRRALAELDEHLLADIGIGRGAARMEAARAPWDPLLPR